MAELKHFSHEHKLILNEAEPVVGKDVECVVCRQPINKHIDAFYTCTSLANGSPSSHCAGFYMHKTCSELPLTFTHPKYPQLPLSLLARPYRKQLFYRCFACNDISSQGYMYGSDNNNFFVCLKCVTFELKSLEERSHCHPGHNHPLTLVQSPASFLCHACNTTATDLSYICTKCCFWIHKSCANAPIAYQSKFHNEHSLILQYSLPEEYCKFVFFCSICNRVINRSRWVYYCANCRFFAHMKCASLIESKNEINDEADCSESNLMHFPVHDEASLYDTMQQCIMNSAIVEHSPFINHWAHKQHQLALGNNSSKELLICDGCTEPISLVNDIFYECNSCNFFLHRSCAQYPKEIEHHLAGKLGGVLARDYKGVLARDYKGVLVRDYKEQNLGLFKCDGCSLPGNGIFLTNRTAGFHLGCASLPRIIKHEAHRHPLYQLKYSDDFFCKACKRERATGRETIMYGCERCEFYIHIWCALRPHLVKHRWDPHPLYLILSLKNVADHPHEFQCEFCSEQINTNSWFYHCNVCDLSFHIHCIDPYYWFSNLKFGATNIYSDSHPHPHGLTLILNKKKGRCNICGRDAFRWAVLECSPCKFIVHADCFLN